MPSETKWPKGPWTQRRFPRRNSTLRVIFAGDFGMGEAYQAEGITDEQADAIANLFCAAPDLYEALEEVLTGGVAWNPKWRDALAKARGESNAK
jgi:hypothetical protein